MSGSELREALSRYFDGDLPPDERAELERVLASSVEARTYVDRLQELRRWFRYEPAEGPDVTERVLAVIEHRESFRRSTAFTVAAAFVAGLVAGAMFIGVALRQPAPVAAADVPELVAAAQNRVMTLTAQLQVTERGRHPDVPERIYSGMITYRAPEALWLELRDDTVYPSADWVPNHVTVVVDDATEWNRSVAGCPTEALPACTPDEPRLSVVVGREPFPEATPAPLDLIIPVAGFARSGEPVSLGSREIDGRDAVGVAVSAAQVASLLDGLTGVGNWRDIHPTDRVELWLDQDALVPLALAAYPAPTPDRRLWAIRRGYSDQPDVSILEVAWSQVVLNGPVPDALPPPPETEVVDASFRDGTPRDLARFIAMSLPQGFTLHRSGSINPGTGPAISVVSWSDGRAWLKIRWTDDWRLPRLFGNLGTLVREVPVASGVAYLNERSDRIGLHGDGVDVVVTGSLPPDALIEVAAGLDIQARPVPDDWAEAATATLAEATTEIDGLLLPVALDGFADPAIRVDPGVVTLAYAGAGNRAFLLIESVDDTLTPPLEANVRGVTVRGMNGRYSPDRGLLEWVEGSLTISLASTTVSLDELVTIAYRMELR